MDSEKRLSALKDVQKNIEKQKLDLEKERKRLLNTRSSILCTSCQQPLADRFEMNTLEASRHDILMDSEKRLSALKDVHKNIEKQKLDLEKERKRLMNTRNSILCTSCQQPLADRLEMNMEGLTNLGLRTAGDGGVYEKVSHDLIKIL